MPYQHDGEDLYAAAKWLYRRYAIKPDREITWERAGGALRGHWLNDAQGLFDAVKEQQIARDTPSPGD
ncbi:hypothetical protein LCGC14_2638900 [marine sediment metagenome]|uniref:Uncharacterized protein n=1 Tax=marine sediment metagenome TaxID=412755 RepID=A0A0F8ZY92_9ZZZZ